MKAVILTGRIEPMIGERIKRIQKYIWYATFLPIYEDKITDLNIAEKLSENRSWINIINFAYKGKVFDYITEEAFIILKKDLWKVWE